MVSALLSRCLILVLGTLYPAYRSYKAIKNKDGREHIKWMMYWIVFALFTTLETFLDIFFSWFPFYYEIKIIFILWVLSPATRGSSLLYKKLVHPMLTSKEKEIDDLIEKTKQQGYSTFLQLFASGYAYASTLVFHSAMKGQDLLGNQLKKSLSMNDVYDETRPPRDQSKTRKPPAERILEDDEDDSSYEEGLPSEYARPKTKSSSTVRKSKSSNGVHTSNGNGHSAYDDEPEIIDSDEYQGVRKTSASRKPRSTATVTSASTYKSYETTHYGSLTRGKTAATK